MKIFELQDIMVRRATDLFRDHPFNFTELRHDVFIVPSPRHPLIASPGHVTRETRGPVTSLGSGIGQPFVPAFVI